ncbi:MAG TPA: phosphopantothenoylcysteine decarboxylase [Terrimicrobiaceae bacterium]
MAAVICHFRVERQLFNVESFDMPLALVTCGPAHEPIDGVRRITNQSTGELGTILSESLSASGFEVLCLRGEMATHPAPHTAKVVRFSTNASLMTILQRLPVQPVAVFHAAALCDFAVHRIEGTGEARKISSAVAELRLILRPAEKILPRLRALVPEALIVGWKYELDGSRADAVSRGREQIKTSNTNACVVNGGAYGEGFGFLERDSGTFQHLASKADLCAFLAGWSLQALSRHPLSAKADRLQPFQAER